MFHFEASVRHSHQKQKAPYYVECFEQMTSRHKIPYLHRVGLGEFDLLIPLPVYSQIYYITPSPVCQPFAAFFFGLLVNKALLFSLLAISRVKALTKDDLLYNASIKYKNRLLYNCRSHTR